MFVVTDESELNWWLRRFAPRISLRLSPDVVEITSPQGVAQSAAVLRVIQEGDRPVVAAIGDEPAAAARFLSLLLGRLPPSGGFIRPVVTVEGVPSLEAALGGQHRAIVTRALAAYGAAAAVIRN